MNMTSPKQVSVSAHHESINRMSSSVHTQWGLTDMRGNSLSRFIFVQCQLIYLLFRQRAVALLAIISLRVVVNVDHLLNHRVKHGRYCFNICRIVQKQRSIVELKPIMLSTHRYHQNQFTPIVITNDIRTCTLRFNVCSQFADGAQIPCIKSFSSATVTKSSRAVDRVHSRPRSMRYSLEWARPV
jgi:hypothetical protein